MRCAYLDDEDEIVVLVVRALGGSWELQVFDLSDVYLVANILLCFALENRHQSIRFTVASCLEAVFNQNGVVINEVSLHLDEAVGKQVGQFERVDFELE